MFIAYVVVSTAAMVAVVFMAVSLPIVLAFLFGKD